MTSIRVTSKAKFLYYYDPLHHTQEANEKDLDCGSDEMKALPSI